MRFSKPQTFLVLVTGGGQLRVESWTADSFAAARQRVRRNFLPPLPGMTWNLFWTSPRNARKAMKDCAYLKGVAIAI